MNVRAAALLALIVSLTSFAFGRYTAPHPDVKSEVKTDINKDTHKTTVIVKDTSGKETTTITEDTVKRTTQTSESVVTTKSSKINISALIGNDFSRRDIVPLYGLSANKEFLGPITVGAFALTTGVIGVSIGLNF